MNSQIISHTSEELNQLVTQFRKGDGFIHGIADVLFNMTSTCDSTLEELDHNSLNSVMYQCIQQADKCNESFFELLEICEKQQIKIEELEGLKEVWKGIATDELEEISSE